MSGAKGTENGRNNRGSATVEAAISLPVFLIVLFSIAYIIRIFHTYNTVQASLSEVARKIGNMSYFYYVAGLKDYSDQLNEMAESSKGTLEDQKNTIVNAFDSFNSIISEAKNTSGTGSVSAESIENIISDAKNFNDGMSDSKELIEAIISDPKAELRLFMTLFAQKLSYEVTNRLVCSIAKGDLAAELNKRVSTARGDAALSMGIKNGIDGISFEQSSVFGDTETIEFVVHYSLKAPVPFSLIPELKLSNRVKIIAWTGGRGKSVRLDDTAEDTEQNTTSSSIWSDMDKDSRYWDRGYQVEEMQTGKIINECQAQGLLAYASSSDYPVIDAYAYNQNTGILMYYDVFTLNPFLKTYSERPSAITYEVKKHALRLMEFEDVPDSLSTAEIKVIKRVVVLVVPENTPDASVDKAKKDLGLAGIEVRVEKKPTVLTIRTKTRTRISVYKGGKKWTVKKAAIWYLRP